MTNEILYGAMGATGDPLTATLVSIDGSLVTAIGLAVFLVGGVLLSAVIRRRRGRRVTLRHALQLLHIRRAAV